MGLWLLLGLRLIQQTMMNFTGRLATRTILSTIYRPQSISSTTAKCTSFFTPLTTQSLLINTRTKIVTASATPSVLSLQPTPLASVLQRHGLRFSSVLKKRRKKMRKHKLRKMRRLQRRSNKNKL